MKSSKKPRIVRKNWDMVHDPKTEYNRKKYSQIDDEEFDEEIKTNKKDDQKYCLFDDLED